MKLFQQWKKTASVVLAVLCTPTWAQSDVYPNKPVKIVVPFAAGGPTDVIARTIANQLKNLLGQPFTIENRTGAGGNIAIKSVAGAAPDGYTLLFSSSNIVSNPAMQAPFDPIKDFAPITYAAVSPNIVYVHPSSPIQNVQDLVAQLKQKSNPTNFATPGVGTTPHIACEGLKFLPRVMLSMCLTRAQHLCSMRSWATRLPLDAQPFRPPRHISRPASCVPSLSPVPRGAQCCRKYQRWLSRASPI